MTLITHAKDLQIWALLFEKQKSKSSSNIDESSINIEHRIMLRGSFKTTQN